MFEAKLANAALLKKIVEAIKDLVTDAPFDCSENAMCLQVPSSFLPPLSSGDGLVARGTGVAETGGGPIRDLPVSGTSWVDAFSCDRTINLGMSLANMAKALKCANNDDNCQIRFDEGEGDSVTFIFTDTKRDKTQEVTVKMMDIDGEHLGIPDQEYACVVEMPAAEFQKTCRDLAMFSDSLQISATKGSISFTGKGDSGSSVVTYSPSSNSDDASEAVTLEVREAVTVNFSIKYMNQFTKATALSDRVRLSLCQDVPVVVEYGIQDNGYLRFYLAPKIDDDENMD